jgi:acetyltransferase-like isoleucine patch superfamily enzyme
LKLGKKTDIGAFTYIQAQEGVEIGDNVQIGSHCAIYSVSTIDDKKGKVVLNNNSKVGSHSTIMPGVEIGENTVIGAHSFVNRSIDKNCVAYGNPVRIIKNENTTIPNQSNAKGYIENNQCCKIGTMLGEWKKVR